MRATILAALLLVLAAAPSVGAAGSVRISQVYGGGGTTYSCDYVELFNNSESPVDIGGWSIQYGSATGSSFGSSTYNRAPIPAGAVIPACGYYLVRGYCATTGSALPVTPDLAATTSWSFNLSGITGKVALFRDQVYGRTCEQARAAGTLADLVGYGGANCPETAPAASGDNASVLVRAAGGAVDSDDNSADFAWTTAGTGLGVPRHSSSPTNPDCLLGTRPPGTPAMAAPAFGASGLAAPVTLAATVSDPDADTLAVEFFGRPVIASPPGREFTLVLLPDTECYTSQSSGGRNAMFRAQTQWIVGQRTARNIAAVAHLGDVTQNDSALEWMRADTAMRALEDPVTTGLADGIPYVMNIGNSDGSSRFNEYFGVSRFSGRGYYGGHYGSTNDHSYVLFSAAGLDFVLVSLAFDPSAAALTWAHDLLASYPGRTGIVVSHSLLWVGNPANWTEEGLPIYQALRDQANLVLMACGHMAGEGRRTDVYQDRPLTTVLSDYQFYPNGGNGWLRILEFKPAANQVRARAYSPWLDQWEADADSSSQFTLTGVPLGGVTQPDFSPLATLTGVPSGTEAAWAWDGLAPGTQYEWYVRASDGQSSRAATPWWFATAAATGVEEPARGPALAAPAPNPARGPLRLSFDLPRAMRARLEVVDVQGRTVAVLADGDLAAGRHQRAWDGRGSAAGLFFVRLRTADGVLVQRVARLR